MTPHEALVEIWELLEYGVKTRVFNEYSQQTINYILKNPKYKDENKINSIIDCIKKHSSDVKDDIIQMYNDIEGLAS